MDNFIFFAGRDALVMAKQKQHADVVKLLEKVRSQQQQQHTGNSIIHGSAHFTV